jgi:hypothetical protein
VREWPVLQLADHLFDDSVPAVVGFGLGERERGVGERRVVAVEGEQLALALGCGIGVEAFDLADDQTCGDLLLLRLRGEGGVLDLGDLGVGDPSSSSKIPGIIITGACPPPEQGRP